MPGHALHGILDGDLVGPLILVPLQVLLAGVGAFGAAMAAGATDNGAPGLRPQYAPDYYAAYVLDADGNNIEAVCHHAP